jgi:hypothetical protein
MLDLHVRASGGKYNINVDDICSGFDLFWPGISQQWEEFPQVFSLFAKWSRRGRAASGKRIFTVIF